MRRLVPLLVLLFLAGLPVASASALSYPVTKTTDGAGSGTLRWAIEEANTNGGADSIPIEVTGTIFLATALPAVEGDLAIAGPGAGSLTLGRGPLAGSFRILTFSSGNVALEGLEISEGDFAPGAGIYNGAGSLTLTRVAVVGNEARAQTMLDAAAHGGGIYSAGPLTLRESVVADNRALAEGSAEGGAEGGGVFALGELTIGRSTISGNLARDLSGGDGHLSALGGGIYAQGGVAIDRSTISGNSVFSEEGLDSVAAGGGLFATGTGQVTGATVTANSALGGAASGANLRAPGAWVFRDTIVAEPEGSVASCVDNFDSGGYNLDEDGSCGLDQGSDVVGVAAGLDPVLRDNGGPTPTHALLAGSVAIDRGSSFGATTDQRGLPRPADFAAIGNREGGDGSDIGAFELQVPPPVPASGGGPVLVSEQPSDRQPPNTRIVKGPARDGYETKAKFRFASTEAQSTFQCKVDKGRWEGCRNPFKRTVKPGKHLFKVRAIDRFGNVDPSPAQFGWRVKPLS
jgi:hypothetical protein